MNHTEMPNFTAVPAHPTVARPTPLRAATVTARAKSLTATAAKSLAAATSTSSAAPPRARAQRLPALGSLRRASAAAGLSVVLLLGPGLGASTLVRASLVVGLALGPMANSWASFDSAMQAWAAGDYRTAARTLKPLADQGDLESCFNLGLYYFQGLGGDRNFPEAARLFRVAAEGGHVMASNNLGAMYMEGRGVMPNPSEAWFWFATVAHRGDQAAGVLRDMAASKMTPVQVEVARKRFNAWVEEHDKPWWKRAYQFVTGSK